MTGSHNNGGSGSFVVVLGEYDNAAHVFHKSGGGVTSMQDDVSMEPSANPSHTTGILARLMQVFCCR